jgi:hypothetical protein
MAKRINKPKPIANPVDQAAASVRKFIDLGMSDNSIWAELEAIQFTPKNLGKEFVNEIRKGRSPEKRPPHRPAPPKIAHPARRP